MGKTSSLSEIKKEYQKFAKKYKLPSFYELNKEFAIEKIQERETDFLLREITAAMIDKISAYVRFLEAFLNPVSAPFFVFVALKGISSQDKEKIEKIYNELAQLELMYISLEINYDEKEEAGFIKETYKKWQELKEEIKEVCNNLMILHSKTEKKSKAYFG